MNATTSHRNAFNALCLIAAKESWCWKINCTTCGHMFFRYGLHELARGNHPDESSWIVSKHHPVLKRGGQPSALGVLPPRWTPWPLDEQRQLAQILSGSCIREIKELGRHPDWLGYLGLGLKYSEDAEVESLSVTKSWVPQLVSLVRQDSSAARSLQSLASDGKTSLTWRNLEVLE
jgi:hypothetical protein